MKPGFGRPTSRACHPRERHRSCNQIATPSQISAGRGPVHLDILPHRTGPLRRACCGGGSTRRSPVVRSESDRSAAPPSQLFDIPPMLLNCRVTLLPLHEPQTPPAQLRQHLADGLNLPTPLLRKLELADRILHLRLDSRCRLETHAWRPVTDSFARKYGRTSDTHSRADRTVPCPCIGAPLRTGFHLPMRFAPWGP